MTTTTAQEIKQNFLYRIFGRYKKHWIIGGIIFIFLVVSISSSSEENDQKEQQRTETTQEEQVDDQKTKEQTKQKKVVSPEENYVKNVLSSSVEIMKKGMQNYTEGADFGTNGQMIMAKDRFEKAIVLMKEAKSDLTPPNFDNENINGAYNKYLEAIDLLIESNSSAIEGIDNNDIDLIYKSAEITNTATLKFSEATQLLNLYMENDT